MHLWTLKKKTEKKARLKCDKQIVLKCNVSAKYGEKYLDAEAY